MLDLSEQSPVDTDAGPLAVYTSSISSSPVLADDGPEYVEALHSYSPPDMPHTSTLAFQKGQIIKVLNKDASGWYDGEVTKVDGLARGWFPSNYTRPISIDKSAAESRNKSDDQSLSERTPMDSFLHSISILQRAAREQRIAHYQPSTACIISAVRAVLATTDCLARESQVLRTHAHLAKSRKQILNSLATLVNQARKITTMALEPAYDPSEPAHRQESQILLEEAQQLMGHVQAFFQATKEMDLSSTDRVSQAADASTGSEHRTTPQTLHKARSLGDMRWSRKESADSQVSMPSVPYSPVTSGAFSLHRSTGSASSLVLPPLSAANSSASSLMGPPTPRATFKNSVEILSSLNGLHDHLLSTIAAFVGHVHAHSRTSHSSSYAHLIDMSCEAIETVHKIVTLVESIEKHDKKRSANFVADFKDVARCKDSLYAATADLVSATETATRGPVDDNTDTENAEKQAMLQSATAVLRNAGACVGGVKRYLRKKEAADQVFELVAQPPPASPLHGRSLLEVNPLRSRHTLSMLGRTATSLSNLKERYEQDGFQRGRVPSLPSMAVSRKNSDQSDQQDEEDALFLRRGLPAPAPLNIKRRKSRSEERKTKASDSSAASGDLMSRQSTSRSVSGSSKPVPVIQLENPSTRSYQPHEISFNRDGQVTGGTLACLVERMTLHDTTIDPNFANAFFLSFRMFTSPPELVDALIARFDLHPPSEVEQSLESLKLWQDKTLTPVRLRVFNMLKSWLESHWHPDSDSTILASLKLFTEEKLSPVFASAATRLSDLIARRSLPLSDTTRLQPASRGTSFEGRRNRAPVDGVPLDSQPPSPTYSVFQPTQAPAVIMSKGLANALRTLPFHAVPITEFDSLELARQITIFESRLFCSIQPSELLGQDFSRKKPGGAVNIKAMTSVSTQMTGWIAEIILNEIDAKKRTQLVKFFIKLADKCYGLRNYNALMAILAALNSSTIARLRRTWDGLSTKYRTLLEMLRKTTDCSRNYAEYRATIRQAATPCLPFLGLYLTDITFCYEGNPRFRPSPLEPSLQLINFDRYARMVKIIADLQRFQVPYNLAEVPDIQLYLSQAVASIKPGNQEDVDRLYRQSLRLEPRTQVDSPSMDKRLDFAFYTTSAFMR